MSENDATPLPPETAEPAVGITDAPIAADPAAPPASATSPAPATAATPAPTPPAPVQPPAAAPPPPAQPVAPPAEAAAPPAPSTPAPGPPPAAAPPAPAPPAAAPPTPPAAAPPPPPAAPAAPAEEEGCSCEEGAPAWVMTFGDLMSLLLCFFILLFSMSSTDAAKFQVAAQSLREALGEASGEFTSAAFIPTEELEAGIVPSSEAITDAAMDVIAERLQHFVEENGLEESVEVSRDGSGVFLRMSDQALFAPGSANINAAAAQAVDQLGEIVALIDIPVIVSGHTDNVPIRSNVFASNWELSAARAAGVARTLVGTGRDPAAVTVEAYGEYRPLADNDTPEGRSQNRRVEVYYSRETLQSELSARGVIDDEAPAAEAASPAADEATEAPAAEPTG